jgi:hypothetical protein
MSETNLHSSTELTFPTKEPPYRTQQFFKNPPESLWLSGAKRLFLCESGRCANFRAVRIHGEDAGGNHKRFRRIAEIWFVIDENIFRGEALWLEKVESFLPSFLIL